MGEGKARVAEDTSDGGVSEGAESRIWLSVYPSPSPNCRAWSPRPAPPRLPGSRERSPPGFFADSCQSGPQPVAQSLPHALPPTLAQTSGSGTAAASLCTADAQTPLTSGFPAAPGADCFRSAGPRRRGEAKHRVTMEMRSGQGEGLSDDNDCFEATLGLAPLSSG